MTMMMLRLIHPRPNHIFILLVVIAPVLLYPTCPRCPCTKLITHKKKRDKKKHHTKASHTFGLATIISAIGLSTTTIMNTFS
mmetsp:Transcript_18890/g.35849  ORF Transcript_18890/g.35849 Transcript_18890/m.35849 type:complete len:82 (-) Transcript_18890:29-274(-)